jgi:mannosyltransferase
VSSGALLGGLQKQVAPDWTSRWRTGRFPASVAALTVVAAAVRFIGIGHQSYWYDEADTVWLIHHSIGHMLAYFVGSETSPPGYFILAWLWGHIFGYREADLRSLSALAGVLTVPIAYEAGVRLFSRRAGLIIAALTASNPLLVWYSQEARSYALMVLLTSIALLAFAELRIRPRRGWMITWVVSGTLALATHYYAALMIVPEGIWLWARYRNRLVVRGGIYTVVIWSTALAVLAWRQLQTLNAHSNWIARIPLVQRAGDVPETFAIGPEAPANLWLWCACAVAAVGSVWLAARKADRRERGQILFVAGLAASGFALVAALVLVGSDQLVYRNLIALWLPVALVIAGGLGLHRFPRAGAAGAIALCTVGMATVIAVAVDSGLQRPAWRSVARVLGSRPDRAIFAVNGCQLLPLSLYLPELHFAPSGGVLVREIDVITVADQTSWNTVLSADWYATCRPQLRGVRVPTQLGPFREVGRPVRIDRFSIFVLRSPSPIRVTGTSFSALHARGDLMVTQPSRPPRE